MKYIVLRADSPGEEVVWGGASVVEADSEKKAVEAASSGHPGHFGVVKLPKEIKTFDVTRSVTVK